jgi:hypothetical protein
MRREWHGHRRRRLPDHKLLGLLFGLGEGEPVDEIGLDLLEQGRFYAQFSQG